MPNFFNLLRGKRHCHAFFTTMRVCLDHFKSLVIWTQRNLKLLKPFWQLVKCLHSDVFCVIVVLLTRHSWPPRGTNVQPSTVIAYTLGLKNSLFSVILSLPFPPSVTLCCCVFAGGRAGGSEWRAWSQWVWDEGWADPVIGGAGSLAQRKRPGKAWGSDPLLGNQVLLTSRSQASRLSRQCRWKKLVRYKHRFLLENLKKQVVLEFFLKHFPSGSRKPW